MLAPVTDRSARKGVNLGGWCQTQLPPDPPSLDVLPATQGVCLLVCRLEASQRSGHLACQLGRHTCILRWVPLQAWQLQFLVISVVSSAPALASGIPGPRRARAAAPPVGLPPAFSAGAPAARDFSAVACRRKLSNFNFSLICILCQVQCFICSLFLCSGLCLTGLQGSLSVRPSPLLYQ